VDWEQQRVGAGHDQSFWTFCGQPLCYDLGVLIVDDSDFAVGPVLQVWSGGATI